MTLECELFARIPAVSQFPFTPGGTTAELNGVTGGSAHYEKR